MVNGKVAGVDKNNTTTFLSISEIHRY